MKDRLVGVDVARCLALLGMVSTHVLASHDPDGSLTARQWLAGGRASALFAVLAGVSLALMTGRRTPVQGTERGRRSLALATRAVLVATIGLALGGLETGIAVILTYYGVLFLMALPFLGLDHQAAAGAGRGLGGRRPGRLPGRPAAPAGTPATTARTSPSSRIPARCCPSCCSPATTRACPGSPTSSSAWRWAARTWAAAGSRPGSPVPGWRPPSSRPRSPLADRPGRGRRAAARGLPAGDDHRPAARRHRRRHVRADPRRRLVGVAAGGGAAQQYAVRPGAHDGLGGLRPRRLPRAWRAWSEAAADARWPCSSVPGR